MIREAALANGASEGCRSPEPRMALLPFAFEESVFEDEEEEEEEEGGGTSRTGGPLASHYNARRCEPEWFCEQVECQDDLERMNIKKFRGDLAYKKQEYQKALQKYSSCLALVPSSNNAMRRDLKESQARCLAHLGKHKEALRIAENLRNGATNTDHLTAILNLQYAIYCLLEDIENVIGCLQRLISLHPFHPQTWNLLAKTYMSLLQFPIPLSGTKVPLWQGNGLIAGSVVCHQTQSQRKDDPLLCTIHTNDSFGSCVESQSVQRPVCIPGNSGPGSTTKRASLGDRRLKDICVYVCASFVRARLLFQLMQLTQSSFALENNLKTQQEIEDKIRFFELEADNLSLMTEVMGEDLVPEKLKGEAQEEVKCFSAEVLPSVMTASTLEFETKWFQKLQGCFPHMDCPT
uniref:Chromosome 8 open reading frame 76 n=1 Tax=Laticauda laticaudata TaxID=8630 RepID=A0A8C5RCS2_LATLA